MRIKRGALHCILIFLAVYSIAYIVEYNNCKHNVECEINEVAIGDNENIKLSYNDLIALRGFVRIEGED